MPSRTEEIVITNNNVIYWTVKHNDRYIVSILLQQACRRTVEFSPCCLAGFPQLILFLMINSGAKLIPGSAPLTRETEPHSRACRHDVTETTSLPGPPVSLPSLLFWGQKGMWLGGRVHDHLRRSWLPSHCFENRNSWYRCHASLDPLPPPPPGPVPYHI